MSFTFIPTERKADDLKPGIIYFFAAQLFSQVVWPGQQFDLKWEWRGRPLCKIEPNSTGSMLNHV